MKNIEKIVEALGPILGDMSVETREKVTKFMDIRLEELKNAEFVGNFANKIHATIGTSGSLESVNIDDSLLNVESKEIIASGIPLAIIDAQREVESYFSRTRAELLSIIAEEKKTHQPCEDCADCEDCEESDENNLH